MRVGGSDIAQAHKALSFWAGLEYMNLSQAPEADERKNVFRIEEDADLPWRNPRRRYALVSKGSKKFKAQIAYCGVFAIRDFTVDLRQLIGAKRLAASDMRKSGDAATLLIPLDDTGRVCGDVFISSLPWFMGRLASHLSQGGSPDALELNGFDAFQDGLMFDVRQLLVQMQLVREDDTHEVDVSAKVAEGAVVRSKSGGAVVRSSVSAAVINEDGRIAGPTDLVPLEVEHVDRLLTLIWKKAGWRPCAAANGDQPAEAKLCLARIKVLTLTRYIDRIIDLRAMNSMVANDVLRVRNLVKEGEPIGAALSQYLKLTAAPPRLDLRDGEPENGLGHFVSMLAPRMMPLGAWPDFPLVSAQQFAVNMSRRHLIASGLYGVNGPPGTGKSTLLRDVIADRIVERADVMAGFSDPLHAFVGSAEIEGSPWRYQQLNQKLHGLGLVVASSNNGAVENVIKDLPKLTGPMSAAGATYFRVVAESIATGYMGKDVAPIREVGSAWGLIAALLGSSEKKRAFLSRFWFEAKDPDASAAELPRLRSLRGVMGDHSHGAKPWKAAVQDYVRSRSAAEQRARDLSECVSLLKSLAQERQVLVDLRERQSAAGDELRRALKEHRRVDGAVVEARERLEICLSLRSLNARLDEAMGRLMPAEQAAAELPSVPDAQDLLLSAGDDFTHATEAGKLLAASKPTWFDLLFDWGAGKAWRAEMSKASVHYKGCQVALKEAKKCLRSAQSASRLLAECHEAVDKLRAQIVVGQSAAVAASVPTAPSAHDQLHLESRLALLVKNSQEALGVLRNAEAAVAAVEQAAVAAESALARTKSRWGELVHQLNLSPSFYESADLLQMDDQELQLAVPYQDDVLRQLRVQVFSDAMQVHQSFVAHAWPKLSPTLSAFVDYQSGKISQAQVGDAAQHLWSAFFAVVPVVSSTFASFDKLFAGLGAEQIGTLLIDEAGQSAPQNAVGAIWRSRRVVAVGDPLQLEPVVTQPAEAISAWRVWTGAEACWEPPACSTQVLVDQMTPVGTWLKPGGDESRAVWVGSPLRVHRRCLGPMFDVANKIAYEHLMVSAVVDDTAQDDWLGPSRWFDVKGSGDGHWIQAQGDVALDLVEKLLNSAKLGGDLKNGKGEWHVNVITPYKDVGTEFGAMLRQRFARVEDVSRMAGTVHTFQGKEADVVILLLGGNPDKQGAVSFYAGNEQSPNLLNVALTRAKKRLYVVGDLKMWTANSSTFRELAARLATH